MPDASKARLLLYGANGYTGRLTAKLAAARRFDVVLAGRHAESLRELGNRLNLPTRVVGLGDAGELARVLPDIACVIHMAGPFALTASPMISACIATRTNYVDITGEIEVFEALWAREDEIRRAGITAVPGAGFDVVPTDCLAGYVAGKLERPTALVIALKGMTSASRGTLNTAIRQVSEPVLGRRAGAIVPLDDPSMRWVDFGEGDEPCVPVSWGDVATAFHSTGVPNITVYFRRSRLLRAANIGGKLIGPLLGSELGQRALANIIRMLPEGPSDSERANHRSVAWAQAVDASGNSATALLSTPDPYDFTADSALEIAVRVNALPVARGLVTPFQAFGADFILSLPGCSRSDIGKESFDGRRSS